MQHVQNIEKEFAELSYNAKLLLKHLSKRGVKLKKLGSSLIVKATYKKHSELLYDIYTSLTTYTSGVIIDDKFYSKEYLRRFNLNVVEGYVFSQKNIKNALDYAKHIKYPVVLKPTVGTHGDQVYLDIRNEEELLKTIRLFNKSRAGNGYFLIEKYYKSNEYRLFITKNNFFAAVARVPANVIGDGKNNLYQLIEVENYRRMNPRNTCLCEIKIDQIVKDNLNRKNLTLNYLPQRDEVVFLRKNSNVSTGGNCYDVTDSIHKTIKDLALKVLTIFDAPVLGIDLLCENITKPLDKYVICELNSAPGLSLHMMPEKGKPRNTASALVDLLFPETI